MKMKSSFFLRKPCLFIFIFLFMQFVCNAQSSKKWIIAAQKFLYTKGQVENSITDATATSLPSDILEKINSNLERNIYPDEKLDRIRYQLRTERQSLYLQLSSEYKKRDSLVLQDLSDFKLNNKSREEEKVIQNINEKIEKNLQKLKEEEYALEKQMEYAYMEESQNLQNETKKDKFLNFTKKIFDKNKAVITNENIGFYQDDVSILFTPPQTVLQEDYSNFKYEKAVYSAGINTLLTGKITQFAEYISVEVEMYLYPGAKKIATVMEIGSIEEMELITTSIANQLVPYLTNSMPVEINFSISPKEALNSEIFIDDVLQNVDDGKIDLQSGVHTIQFSCEGFKTAKTTYYFEGNEKYYVDAQLVELQQKTLSISLKKEMIGELFINGLQAEKINEKTTQIMINGNKILGEFVGENGESSFFYVPLNKSYDTIKMIINPKPFDRDKYIDTRRKWMYGSYSAFIVSLIPLFVSYGSLMNKVELYKNGNMNYNDAIKWQYATNICAGISIGLGGFWGYELVRYLIAANSVLPEKAKEVKK